MYDLSDKTRQFYLQDWQEYYDSMPFKSFIAYTRRIRDTILKCRRATSTPAEVPHTWFGIRTYDWCQIAVNGITLREQVIVCKALSDLGYYVQWMPHSTLPCSIIYVIWDAYIRCLYCQPAMESE